MGAGPVEGTVVAMQCYSVLAQHETYGAAAAYDRWVVKHMHL